MDKNANKQVLRRFAPTMTEIEGVVAFFLLTAVCAPLKDKSGVEAAKNN
jgi:hypothetical protein